MVDVDLKSNDLEEAKLEKKTSEKPVKGSLFLKVIFYLCFIVTALYFAACYSMGQSRAVYLVNGMSQDYTVSINGEEFAVKALSAEKIAVSGSDIKYKITNAGLEHLAGEIEINDDFFQRPFLSKSYVLNPDKSAIIVWQKVSYRKGVGTPEHDPKQQAVLLAKDLYVFDKIDYLFEDAAKKMEVKAADVFKQQVKIVTKMNSARLVQLAQKNISEDREKYQNFLKTSLISRPDALEVVDALKELVKKDEFIKILRSHLDRRPVHIDWHRYYQAHVTSLDPEHDLEAEYRLYLDKEKDNTYLMYLLAREMPKASDAFALYTKSAESKRSCPWAYYGLAYHYIARGEFEKVLDCVEKTKKGPLLLRRSMGSYQYQAMLGLKQYDKLLALFAEDKKRAPLNDGIADKEIMLYALKGDEKKARQVIEDFVKLAKEKKAPQKQIDAVVKGFNATLDYIKGDIDSFVENRKGLKSLANAFILEVMQGKLDEADAILTKMKTNDFSMHIVMYIAAKMHKNKKYSSLYLNTTCDLLKRSGKGKKRMALMLLSDKAPTKEVLENNPHLIYDQRLFMAAMALRFPEIKKFCGAWGNKMNIEPRFPQKMLSKVFNP
jgi:tetratricopeptide (TPR) repeat protein